MPPAQQPKEKVLISVLGRGQFDKQTKTYDYKLTKYALEEAEPFESKLVSDILARILNPQKIYIIGTEESIWHVADNNLPSYEKVLVPYGTSSSEFWEMFDRLTKLDVENREIYFDITHGFRSIPVFISTILNFFENVKNADVKGLYYGIFEAQQNGVTPVINMLPFLEMNDWIDAFTIFRKYSDGRDIAQMMKKGFKKIPNLEKKTYGKIQNTYKELDFYSKAIGFSAVDFYQDSLEYIKTQIENIETVPPLLKAASYLLVNMKEEAKEFEELDKTWEKHLKAASLLYEKNRYAQSLTVLREVIRTYILEELGLDIKDETLRERQINKIVKEEKELFQNTKQTKYLSPNFLDLIQKVNELRNKANHAFIKKESIGKKDIKNSVENLKKFLKDCQNYLDNDSALINKNALKQTLTSEE